MIVREMYTMFVFAVILGPSATPSGIGPVLDPRCVALAPPVRGLPGNSCCHGHVQRNIAARPGTALSRDDMARPAWRLGVSSDAWAVYCGVAPRGRTWGVWEHVYENVDRLEPCGRACCAQRFDRRREAPCGGVHDRGPVPRFLEWSVRFAACLAGGLNAVLQRAGAV
ncbi:hypothetical protein C8Q77DRAFT_808021 [Trametes polyzona]|nr:hypothetical protein C8Q77DRAFT_808021 [Trametes polyzona]